MNAKPLLPLLALATACQPARQAPDQPAAEPTAAEQTVAAGLPAPARPTPTTAPVSSGCASAGAFPQRLQALGTEPFWSIARDGAKLTYSSPDNQAGTSLTAQCVETGGKLRFTGRLDGKPLELMVTAGSCSDGMSDTVYPFAATLKLGGDTLKGCARPLT